mgnify:CR=1 FL=1
MELLNNESAGHEELVHFINRITTNETHFFREQEQFKILEERVIPNLIMAQPGKNRMIRIWSSACSSGEEPYSIAFTLLPLSEKNHGFQFKILGTDINSEVLDFAKTAIYEAKTVERKISKKGIDFYFKKIDQDHYQVKDHFRRSIDFKQLNLLDDRYPIKAKLDIIFCRNVMIYFNEDIKNKIIGRFWELLQDDGFLFLGHSETILAQKEKFQLLGNAVYKKR